jgi:hypothetical protein
VESAAVLAIAPPPVQGIGSAGGFKMMVEYRNDLGPEALEQAVQGLVTGANHRPPAVWGFHAIQRPDAVRVR